MLSHDWTIALGYMSPGYPSREENPDGYLWITHKVLPRLRELGISDDVIAQMTVENPRRYFEGT
jgi:predicted metal-dependent phosphotriesterase family hydrolase